jgi:succinate dehydrogenase / fumarate reductase, membrane anchor subunit
MGRGTPIARVRGLGSAKSGGHHWWLQRVTAAGNILLMSWFMVALIRLPAYDYKLLTEWLQSPLVAVPMILLIASTFWHFRLGLQVFIEDYLHGPAGKLCALLALNLYTIGGAALAIFSILKIAFAGAAS